MRLYHPSKPHFFRPLIPGFINNSYIPKSFRKHLGGKTQGGEKMALLRDKSGRIWDVKIELGNKFRFKDGWEDFCKDHDMQIGDLLLFRHRGYWVFDVWVMDPSACEREFLVFDYESVTMVQPTSPSDVRSYETHDNPTDEAPGCGHEGEQSEAHKQVNPIVENDVVRPLDAVKGSDNNHEIQLGDTYDEQRTREIPKNFRRDSTSIVRKDGSYRYYCKQCEKGFKSPQAALGHIRWTYH